MTIPTPVRDLGIFIDSDLVMRSHVQRTVSRCFATLHQLLSIRRSVPTSTMQALVVSLVLSHTSGSSDLPSTSAGVSVEIVARLICDLCQSDNITDALASLH